MTEKIQNFPTKQTSSAPKLSEKKEKADKAILEITTFLQGNYKNEKPGTKEQKISEFKQVNKHIRDILQQNGIKIASLLPDDRAVRKFFKDNGYLAYFSPIGIGNDKYLLNTPVFKIGRVETFDGSHIKPETGGDFGTTDIHIISEVLIPEILTEKMNMSYDGRTIQDPRTNTSVIWIDEQLAKKNANTDHLSYEEYKEAIILNEVSQKYFSEIIPTRYYGTNLGDILPNFKNSGLKIIHLLEAFSDYTTLKYGDDSIAKSEIKRIATSNDYQYILSKELTLQSIGEISTLENIDKLNEEQVQAIKESIIQKHQESTLRVMQYIGNQIQSAGQ